MVQYVSKSGFVQPTYVNHGHEGWTFVILPLDLSSCFMLFPLASGVLGAALYMEDIKMTMGF